MDLTSPSRRQTRDSDLGKSIAALPTTIAMPHWARQLDALVATRKAAEEATVASSRWLQRLGGASSSAERAAADIAGSRWLDCLQQELSAAPR